MNSPIPMMAPDSAVDQIQATVIIPTHDHGMTIRYPIECLKNQTVSAFEAYVIGDGVPEETKPSLKKLISEDDRFHFIDRPKHSRRGEPYRHEVLLAARGRIVCYLCDRDLWLPNHLESMIQLMSSADYGHSLPLHVLPGGNFRTFPVDLGFAGYRHMMLNMRDNRIPFSCFGHTLKAYLSLKEGWTTTPDNAWTDLHMFRKFFADEALTGASGVSPTAVTFPSPPRKDWPLSDRVAELAVWEERLSSDAGRLTFENAILRNTLLQQRAEAARLSELATQLNQQLNQQLNSNRASSLWRGFA